VTLSMFEESLGVSPPETGNEFGSCGTRS